VNPNLDDVIAKAREYLRTRNWPDADTLDLLDRLSKRDYLTEELPALLVELDQRLARHTKDSEPSLCTDAQKKFYREQKKKLLRL